MFSQTFRMDALHTASQNRTRFLQAYKLIKSILLLYGGSNTLPELSEAHGPAAAQSQLSN